MTDLNKKPVVTAVDAPTAPKTVLGKKTAPKQALTNG